MKVRWKLGLITASTLLAVAATLALGRWQLSRAAQKEALQASLDSQAAQPRLDLRVLLARVDPMAALYQPVVLRGRWVSARTVFLDNRQMNNKPGLYAVTPMQLDGSDAVVLVQRGWVARNFIDRTQVVPIETPSGLVQIQGRIVPPPSKLMTLGASETGLIRQNLDLDSFRTEMGLPLLPVSVQQTDLTRDGLLREWPQVGLGIDKHYGYAFQWFALSALIAILYVWFQIVRRFFITRRT